MDITKAPYNRTKIIFNFVRVHVHETIFFIYRLTGLDFCTMCAMTMTGQGESVTMAIFQRGHTSYHGLIGGTKTLKPCSPSSLTGNCLPLSPIMCASGWLLNDNLSFLHGFQSKKHGWLLNDNLSFLHGFQSKKKGTCGLTLFICSL